jgi:hypothetical protein
LETKLDVQDEEEHKKERNKNYKHDSWTQLVAIDGNVKIMLFPRSRSIQSTSSVECHFIRTNKGGTLLISMKARNFVLQLINSLQGYDMGFQQKVVVKMFIHDVMRPLMPNACPTYKFQ